MKRIATVARNVKEKREDVVMAEHVLQQFVQEFLNEYPGGVREAARKMGLSAAYVSDIRLGRRKISAAVIEKLTELR